MLAILNHEHAAMLVLSILMNIFILSLYIRFPEGADNILHLRTKERTLDLCVWVYALSPIAILIFLL